MSALIYLDNSNLWIEGKKVSAVQKGRALDVWEATDTKTFDNDFKLDFGQALAIANHAPIRVARFYGSRPPEADSVWKAAELSGFDLIILNRNQRNKEKGVDSTMVMNITEDMLTIAEQGDVFIIMAGDADYLPVVNNVKAKGFEVHVLFWDHASAELKKAADNFLSLNGYLHQLQY